MTNSFARFTEAMRSCPEGSAEIQIEFDRFVERKQAFHRRVETNNALRQSVGQGPSVPVAIREAGETRSNAISDALSGIKKTRVKDSFKAMYYALKAFGTVNSIEVSEQKGFLGLGLKSFSLHLGSKGMGDPLEFIFETLRDSYGVDIKNMAGNKVVDYDPRTGTLKRLLKIKSSQVADNGRFVVVETVVKEGQTVVTFRCEKNAGLVLDKRERVWSDPNAEFLRFKDEWVQSEELLLGFAQKVMTMDPHELPDSVMAFRVLVPFDDDRNMSIRGERFSSQLGVQDPSYLKSHVLAYSVDKGYAPIGMATPILSERLFGAPFNAHKDSFELDDGTEFSLMAFNDYGYFHLDSGSLFANAQARLQFDHLFMSALRSIRGPAEVNSLEFDSPQIPTKIESVVLVKEEPLSLAAGDLGFIQEGRDIATRFHFVLNNSVPINVDVTPAGNMGGWKVKVTHSAYYYNKATRREMIDLLGDFLGVHLNLDVSKHVAFGGGAIPGHKYRGELEGMGTVFVNVFDRYESQHPQIKYVTSFFPDEETFKGDVARTYLSELFEKFRSFSAE